MAFKKLTHEELKQLERKCMVCGKAFMAYRCRRRIANQQTCSIPCKNKYARALKYRRLNASEENAA